MSIKTATNRFILPSFRISAGFYQQLAAATLSFQELGNTLIRYAEQARTFRQTEQVKELGLMLANIPLPYFQTAGYYYLGWAMYRSGDREQAKNMLEQVAQSGAGTYQARALLSLGTLEAAKQDFASEARYYLEAFKASHSLSTKVEAIRGIAVIKAKEGYHKSSVKDFEKFMPLAMNSDPLTYNLYIGSLAVELAESGRIYEARNISRIVINLPFAFAYPELRETWQDLALRGYKSRSSVPVIQSFFKPKKTQNVLNFPERERSENNRRSPFFQPSDVTSLKDWTNKMVKEPNGDDKPLPEDMTAQDMAMKILELITDNKDDEEKIRKLMESAIKYIGT